MQHTNHLPQGSPVEVFRAFFTLGLSSFGGPVAHLGYFHRRFVERDKWLNQAQYAELLALCQLLPGPASSQLGFALGLKRAGWLGALAAFIGFTLPSALLMLGFAWLLPSLQGDFGNSLIHSLKLVALLVVADAVRSMAQNLCKDRITASLALGSCAFMLLFSQPGWQLATVLFGALIGWRYAENNSVQAHQALQFNLSKRLGSSLLIVFALLLLLSLGGSFAGQFFQAGALVFGGGHVVLPLLEASQVTAQGISESQFLAGYGAAQALPGPLFSFASYLGALSPAMDSALFGALVAVIAIFLPGLLLVSAMLPFWQQLSAHPAARRAIVGINASVVGLLAAALYNPIFTSAVHSPLDLAIALFGFTLLAIWRVSIIYILLGALAIGLLRYWLG